MVEILNNICFYRKIFYKNLRKERKKEWKRNNPGRRMPSQDEMDDAESVMV
jgi:hypothetical protein